jgi:hypothetical protein
MSSTGLLLLVMLTSVQGIKQDADCASSSGRMAKWGNWNCDPETSGCELWPCISTQGLCDNHKNVCISKAQAAELRECAAYGNDKSNCDADAKCTAVSACGFTACAEAGATALKNETEVCASTATTAATSSITTTKAVPDDLAPNASAGLMSTFSIPIALAAAAFCAV